MVRTDEAKWIEQAKALFERGAGATHELPPFAVSMLTYFYGSNSPQLRNYEQAANNFYKDKNSGPAHQIFRLAHGTVATTIRELENGLVASLKTSIQGELLGDFVNASKQALSENTEETKNIAAVLAAAAFEDCLRRLALEKAGVTDRPKLEEVLGKLRDAGLVRGGNISLATSMLKFRNDSLHADWKQVQRAQVESCLALTEAILREHFS